MSREDLWRVVGRAKFDLDFGGRLLNDFEKTVSDAGYELDPEELMDAKRAIEQPVAGGFPMGTPGQSDPRLLQKRTELMAAQMDRMADLNAYMFKTVKETFLHARTTYKAITWMNWIMFGTGIGLFIFAALYAAYSREKIYSLLFGGLGAASFVAQFILGPIEKTQRALSNLVQTEVAFMNYFDQILFWEGVANIPRAMPPGMPPSPDPANIEKASAALQERSRETIELLKRSVGDAGGGEGRRMRRDRKAEQHPAATPQP